MGYIIRPIALCEGMRDMSQWTYRWNIGKTVRTACYLWYIEGSDPPTLIDTGAQAEHYTNPEFAMTNLLYVEDGLARLGIKALDIKSIIVTHLHFDHIALSDRFPNATFTVQKKEFEFACNPHIFNAIDYNPVYFRELNFRVIDGDADILPGIKVLLTPGHSPGAQSVQVETRAGKAIITGFCSQMSTFEQTPFMRGRGLEVAACGLHTDCREAYDSALRVKKLADIIIPCHDPRFMEAGSIP